MEIPPISAVAGLLMLAAIQPACAQSYESLTSEKTIQIVWASDAFTTSLMADGTTTFGGTPLNIQFELGTFTAGFDPRGASPAEWAANWVVLQTAMYDKTEQQVIETATLGSNAAPFAENTQAYIWGYTTKDLNSGVAEWIMLAADEWKWPSVDSLQPPTFSVSDAAKPSEMILGSVNGSYNGVSYHMQLASVTAVPEPSVMALPGLALLGLALRRKR
ncbi:PEP-CTERM sorting domain-containing protein [Luteolibacter sp. SL250]|uniref:PEP-CTERM sorting domain-containing protein n=1 Tax=Luteolibacter sp. SL250 TaxID=2995170 RepID=UPI00226ECBAA|nr:PEP-CTERM sorting domain-containing protein [Luteolibacter sp. SL250]WAC20739.1 PEP-CTERM sorting domain-containing protein [Luteolibacter sp. SL250]